MYGNNDLQRRVRLQRFHGYKIVLVLVYQRSKNHFKEHQMLETKYISPINISFTKLRVGGSLSSSKVLFILISYEGAGFQ